jgi:hypothetical protein
MQPSPVTYLPHRNPWLAMPLLVLVVYGAYLAALWPLADHHLYGYISFNTKRVNAASSFIPQEHVSKQFGYDGQFYYRLALDPFSSERQVQGLSIDHPAWRQQRILLPVLTWLIARGDPENTAVVMLAINLLAVAGMTLVGGLLLRYYQLSPWPALLLAFYPGFAISALRFLTEPLSCLLLFTSILLLVNKKVLWAGLVLALAVLARETALAAALAVAGAWCLQSALRLNIDRWRAPGPVFWLPAIGVYVALQWWLIDTWSTAAFSPATKGRLLHWPLTGIATSLKQMAADLNAENAFYLLMMLATFLWILLVAARFSRAHGPVRWMWLAYLALAVLMGVPIWNNSPGFMRTLTELHLLGLCIYLLAISTPRRWLVMAWFSCWLLTAGAEAYRLHLIEQAELAVAANIAG